MIQFPSIFCLTDFSLKDVSEKIRSSAFLKKTLPRLEAKFSTRKKKKKRLREVSEIERSKAIKLLGEADAQRQCK